MMRVSVVIPCHNGEKYLAAAIRSILAQRHAVLEVIVVDNGSSDGSAAIAASFGGPVRVVAEPVPGISHAREAGIVAARGDVFAFCDADDLWDDDRLPAQLAHLAQCPATAISTGLVAAFISDEIDREGAPIDTTPHFFRHPGAMLIRRDLFDRIGTFGRQQGHDTLEWIGRAARHGLTFDRFDRTVMHRRVHHANHSRHDGVRTADFARSLKQVLDQRRGTMNGAA